MRSAQPSSQHTVSRWEQGERRSSAGPTCGPGGASWTWGRSAGQHPQGPGSVLHTPRAAGCCQPTLATAPLFSSSFFKWHPPRLRALPAALCELAPPPQAAAMLRPPSGCRGTSAHLGGRRPRHVGTIRASVVCAERQSRAGLFTGTWSISRRRDGPQQRKRRRGEHPSDPPRVTA